ncbi:MAG: hypothetical protein HOA37_03960 [Flavobacteriales bacterium]|nr:hypothetical protein [Flavobacteriales bacterium]MBT6916411.1 hypothetical protein [Flavobacteriales bacterium]
MFRMNGAATQIIEMHCISGLEKDVRGSKTVDASAWAVEKMPQGSFLIFTPLCIKTKWKNKKSRTTGAVSTSRLFHAHDIRMGSK